MVDYKRHIAKTISYRILSTGIGFIAMWFITGSVEIGAAFSILELVWKPIQYYIHERVWYRWIKFGLIETQIKNETPFRKINDHLQDMISKEIPIIPPSQDSKIFKEGEQPIKKWKYYEKSGK